MKQPNLQMHTNIARVEKVVNYIETNLTDNLSLAKLASVAAVSPFHFHRIFSQITGETTHEFVQRKRIERIASRLLKVPNTSIKDLSMHYGFDNAVTFSRAFKKFYGISASALRKTAPQKAQRLIRKRSKIGKDQFTIGQYLEQVDQGLNWISEHGSVMTKEINDLKIAYIRNRGPFESIDPCFEALAQWAKSYSLFDNEKSKWILIVHDNPDISDSSKMMLSAGLLIDEEYPVDNGINLMTIPAGRFLVGKLSIREEEFKYAWDCMSSILLSGNYVLRDGYFFEVFLTNSLFISGQKHEVELFLPIE